MTDVEVVAGNWDEEIVVVVERLGWGTDLPVALVGNVVRSLERGNLCSADSFVIAIVVDFVWLRSVAAVGTSVDSSPVRRMAVVKRAVDSSLV